MPNVSSFGAQTDNAVVSGTVTDRQVIIPEVPPQGLMSVGPRVTPNFIKEPWSKLRSYNFFDAVKDTAGSSYIAIKPVVPTNTELTDEEFWFKWSDPDAQLNELQEIVKTYNERISQNASAITAEVARAKAAEEAEEQRATAAEATKAPVNHASEETVYGVGNAVNYGHLKLADDDTPMTSDANAGVAATPKLISAEIAKTVAYINALYNGCAGDGMTDDTVALQNCIDICAEKKLTLYMPAGVYKVSKSLQLKNNTSIVGETPHMNNMNWVTGPTTNGTVIKQTVIGENVFTAGKNEDVNGVSLKNIALFNDAIKSIGENPDTYTNGAYGIFFDRCSKFDLDGIAVAYFQTGIQINDTKVGDSTPYIDSGERKVVRNISVSRCINGIIYSAADTFGENIVVSNCAYGVRLATCKISGLHLWAIKNRAITLFNGAKAMITNLEIEGTGNYAINSPGADAEIAYEVFMNDGGTLMIDNMLVWNVRSGDAHTIINVANGACIVNSLIILGNAGNITNKKLPRIAWANTDNATIVVKSAYIDDWYTEAAVDPLVTGNTFIGEKIINANSTLTLTKEKTTKLSKSLTYYIEPQSYNPFN